MWRRVGASRAGVRPPRARHAAAARRRGGREGRGGGSVFYASHAWHPFFLQGTKTLAYELWEDLGFRAPDNVVIPTAAGPHVSAARGGAAADGAAVDTSHIFTNPIPWPEKFVRMGPRRREPRVGMSEY